MFGKRTDAPPTEQKARPPAKPQPVTKPSAPKTPEANPEARAAAKPKAAPPKKKAPETVTKIDDRSDEYYRVKTMVFNALIDTIDLSQLAQLDAESARVLLGVGVGASFDDVVRSLRINIKRYSISFNAVRSR